MENPNKARANLRQRMLEGETIVAPGCYDAITAAVLQHLGYKAAYLGGWMTGASLGTTEPLLTLLDQVECARRAMRLIDIPLIVDGHTGFGDPLHVIRAVREYEDAGISGMHIEDQYYPKRAHYHSGREHIIPIPDFIERIEFALKARRDPNLIIIGRTDAIRAVEGGSISAVIERVKILAETGVDAVMPMVWEVEQMQRVRDAVPDVKLVALAGYLVPKPSREDITFQQMAEIGYQVIIFPLPTIIATVGAALSMNEIILKDGVSPLTGYVGFNAEIKDDIRLIIEKMIKLPEYCCIEKETVEKE